MMFRKIYIVTRGDYSDYGIRAVFSSRKKADEFTQTMNKKKSNWSEPYEIEVWPLNVWDKEATYYRVMMWKDGTVHCYFDEIPNAFNGFETRIFKHERIQTSGSAQSRKEELLLETTVEAKNDKHAVKIVNEKRLQLIAANQFVETKE